MRFIAQLSSVAAELPLSALNNLVTDAVDIVVHCARLDGRIRVTEILAVEDLQGGADATTFTTTSVFERRGFDTDLEWTGNVPARAEPALETIGYDIRNEVSA